MKKLFEAPLNRAHSLRLGSTSQTDSQIEYVQVLSAIRNLFNFHQTADPDEVREADFNFLTNSLNILTTYLQKQAPTNPLKHKIKSFVVISQQVIFYFQQTFSQFENQHFQNMSYTHLVVDFVVSLLFVIFVSAYGIVYACEFVG